MTVVLHVQSARRSKASQLPSANCTYAKSSCLRAKSIAHSVATSYAMLQHRALCCNVVHYVASSCSRVRRSVPYNRAKRR